MRTTFFKLQFCLLIALVHPVSTAADGLPEVLVSFDGGRITRARATELVRLKRPAVREDSADFRDLLRRAADEELCRIAIDRRLRKAGFRPSFDTAYACLRRMYRALPEKMKRPSDSEMRKTAADPEMQMRLAVQWYLLQTSPGALSVSDAEIEDFYREHQEWFRRPASLQAEVLRTAPTPAGREAMIAAEARVLQGEEFGRVAAATPERVEAAVPEDVVGRIGASLKEGEVSKMVELPSGYVLMRAVRRIPAGYYSLEEAREYIRQELMMRRSAKELRKIVSETLPDMRVRYHF